MTGKARLLSIHATQERAVLSRSRLVSEWEREHSWIELAPRGSTSELPWGVLAPVVVKAKGG